MDNNANNALVCDSDIKPGEKKDEQTLPEGSDQSQCCDAGNTNISGSVGEMPTPEEDLDAEFEALIKGKYREAYKKRTEGIVKRRLRSSKAHTALPPLMSSDRQTAIEGENNIADSDNASKNEIQKMKNTTRPTENGVGGSIGVYTRINVSALTGRDVREIIGRAASGEKITFG